MTRRTLLVALGATSAGLGAAGSFLFARQSGARGNPRGRVIARSDRSVYELRSRWTTDDGRALQLAELGGRIELLGMMFTSCPSVCPTFVREMRALDLALPEKLRERTHTVFVSIDPEHDTPEALRRYREKMGLDRERFTLLRGAPGDVRELAQVIGVSYAKTEGSEIAHTRLVTVLDSRGEVSHQQIGVTEDREGLIAGIRHADGLGAG